jgi:hypothetical protein
MRIAFAQRVVERVALRVCRLRGGHRAAQGIVRWVEMGDVNDTEPADTDGVVWTRPDNAAWPANAVERLLAWADAQTPCARIMPSSPQGQSNLGQARQQQ